MLSKRLYTKVTEMMRQHVGTMMELNSIILDVCDGKYLTHTQHPYLGVKCPHGYLIY